MRTIDEDAALPNDACGVVWAIGNFDGLHRGHHALFKHARAVAAAHDCLSGVLTFDPHPARILNPALAPPLILTAAEKQGGIAAAGIDVYRVLRFDHALASLSATEFCRRVLVEGMLARGVVVGEGFRFGHHAAGTVADLRAALAVVDEVSPVKEGDLVCSSSKIREFVLAGRVDAAAMLLGRPYFLDGIVVEGDKRGRAIGVPTANLLVTRELLPRVGVYATRAFLPDGRVFASVTNIGLRPTFQGQDVRIEVHLLGFSGDLYGSRLGVDVIHRIRDEMRFDGAPALVDQIRRDIEAARACLASSS